MKILLIPGSLRKQSLNKKLALAISRQLIETHQIDAEILHLEDYDLPVFNEDLETAGKTPQGVEAISQKILAAQAVVICTPEYNGSIPGGLKNLLDWLSRREPVDVVKGKHFLLCAASPGALGGVRSLWHTRVPFEVLGGHVYPDMVGVAKADQVLVDSQVNDPRIQKRLTSVLAAFVQHVRKFND